MKRFAHFFIMALAIFLLSACANGANDSEEAKKNLVAFFESLNRGEYDKAAELYGGGYEALVDFNPALDPGYRTALLKNGCEINGLQRLIVLTADFKKKNAKGEYIFVVQFKGVDGKLYVQQTPNAPPMSVFEYRVMKGEDGTLRVLDLPVYVN